MKKKMVRNYARRLLGTEEDSEHGRSLAKVKCSCGKVSWFFIWSWAGHGKAKCWSCKRWIMYRNLEVCSGDFKG